MWTRFSWPALIIAILLSQYLFIDNINPYVLKIINFAGINIILAVSLNLINGFTGQFSMGHAGFMAIGAYMSSVASLYIKAHYPNLVDDPLFSHFVYLAVIFIGGLFAALSGFLVGLPSLRLRGDYLAVVTLGFGEIIRVVILNIDAVGAARGMPGIPNLNTFAWTYVFALLTIYTITRLMKSAKGRELLSVREDEIAAEAMGVNTTQVKIFAFTFGAAFAGMAGALFAHELSFLSPASFESKRSFEIIIMVVLGGMGSITGSVFTAVLLTALPEMLRDLQDYRMVIYSLVLILLMILRPSGIFGNRELHSFFPSRIQKFFGINKAFEA